MSKPDSDESKGRDLLTESILDPKMKDIAVSAADLLFSEAGLELIKGVPIVGWIAKIGGGIIAIRDRIFVRKVISFLSEAAPKSEEERTQFAERIAADQAEFDSVADATFEHLDSISSHQKASLLGFFYLNLLRDEIEFDDYYAAAEAILRLPLWHLLQLPEYYASSFSSLSNTVANVYFQHHLVDVFYGPMEKVLLIEGGAQVVCKALFFRTMPGQVFARVVRDYRLTQGEELPPIPEGRTYTNAKTGRIKR